MLVFLLIAEGSAQWDMFGSGVGIGMQMECMRLIKTTTDT